MSKLHWYKLRFPRDLKEDAVIAVLSALSGVDARTRLVFRLSATSAGIEHQIGVSAPSADSVTAELRAAIPSLHYEQIESGDMSYQRRLLWQLAPARGAIRTDNLASIAASLCASVQPLYKGEVVSLAWTMRPAVRPTFEATPEARSTGRVRALRDKLALPGLAGYGELSATGSDPAARPTCCAVPARY